MGKEDNPTFYRKPIDYHQMLNYVRNSDKAEEECFRTVQSKSLFSYIRVGEAKGASLSVIQLRGWSERYSADSDSKSSL